MSSGSSARAILGAVALALIVMGAAPPRQQSAYGYPWRGRVPVTITVIDNGTGWRIYLDRAAADWSLSPVVDVVVVTGSDTCSDRGKVTSCAGPYGLGDQHVAWTLYDSHNGFMTDAAMYFNRSYIDGYTNADGVVFPPYSEADRQHLACHEMSHALGIIAEGGCSDGSWLPSPTAIDYARLLDIYGPG